MLKYKKSFLLLVLFFAFFGLAKIASAGTHYMPDNCANFSACFSQMNSGDTLIIRNGTYNQTFADIPNGTAENYTTIKAENDGGVIITGGMGFSHTNQYIQVEGLKFKSTESKGIIGNHIKFLRCGFDGGPATDNTVTFGIGTNDYNDTAYILLEDCWAYGLGGRYNVLVYNSNNIILRRLVVRHDGGWTDTKGDPEAAISIYNSSFVELQNNIVIDSTLAYHAWEQAFYIIYNSASPNITNNVHVRGNIVLNVVESAYRFDGSPSTVGISTWTDNIGYAYSGGGIINGSSNVNLSLSATKSTFGLGAAGLGAWGGGDPSINNSVIYNMSGYDTMGGFGMSYLNRYNNGASGSCSPGCQTYNPQTNGLLYLPRIESGSILATGGQNGGRIGADVTKKIGVSGTLYGEAGYNTTTSDNLWPFPNEARIKSDMASVSTRGFCSGTSKDGLPQTLTKYIWEYLGNQIPADVYGSSGDTTPPAAPSGLAVS